MQLAFTGVFKHMFCDFSCFWKSAGEDMHHFFVLILQRFFVDFFADFKSLETLKIVLPCRREHYFYKIDVFASSPKIDPKTIEIWVQKSMKIWKSHLPTKSENVTLLKPKSHQNEVKNPWKSGQVRSLKFRSCFWSLSAFPPAGLEGEGDQTL